MKFRKILKIPLIFFNDITRWFIAYIPGPTGIYIRRFIYKILFKKCGKNLIIDVGVMIEGANLISVGDNVHIDKYSVISTGTKLLGSITKKNNSHFNCEEGEIVIGNDVHLVQFTVLMGFGGIQLEDGALLCSGCKVYSLTNLAYSLSDREQHIPNLPYTKAEFLAAPVYVGANSFVGLNTIIMPGVTLGRDSFVVSNSLLMGSYGENSYISGQPATVKGKRFGR